MLSDVVLPNVGFGMEEGRLISWLKQPGDSVRKGEPIAEVEGDKATVELEAVVDGVLAEILIPADQVVPVGTVLARIRAEGQAVSEPARAEPEGHAAQAAVERAEPSPVPVAARETTAASGEAARVSPIAQRLAQDHGIDLNELRGTGPGGRITRDDVQSVIDSRAANGVRRGKVLAAPAVRRLARDRGIDLAAIRGTGPDGHVTRADVEAALRAREMAPAAAPAAEAVPAPTPAPADDRVEVPLTQIRQVIARRLAKSAQEAPHFFTTAQLDMTDALRNLPQNVGINALLLYLTVQALKDNPDLNATYEDGRLYHYAHVHLSIAVALPDGLMSPVLRRADDYSLEGLAERAKDLIQRTRAGRLRSDEMGGGTFTVSNLGIVEQVERFTAILNPPQVGILAIGAAKERPVVIDHGLHIRTTAYVTLSADHRVIDGLVAARFLESLDGHLQAFGRKK